MDCHCLIVGGHHEHIHLLYRKPSGLLTSDMIKELKRQSSLWFKENNHVEPDFHWQSGYGAFSISYWDLDKLNSYIRNQADHHREVTWEEEYRCLLEQHGIKYDERFFLD